MSPEDLVPGRVILVEDGESLATVRVAALFRKAKSKKIRALCVRLTDAEVKRLHLTPIAVPGRISNDTFVSVPRDAQIGSLEDLFVVVEFGPIDSKTLAEAVEPVVLSRDIRRNVFAPRKMRVRTFATPSVFSGARHAAKTGSGFPKVNSKGKTYRKGFLSGDVLNQTLSAKSGRQVVVDRLAFAQGNDKKALAGPGEGGTPVISSSGALVGFVVSGTGDSALVLPAEDLAKRLHIHLMQPKHTSSPIKAMAAAGS